MKKFRATRSARLLGNAVLFAARIFQLPILPFFIPPSPQRWWDFCERIARWNPHCAYRQCAPKLEKRVEDFACRDRIFVLLGTLQVSEKVIDVVLDGCANEEHTCVM